MTKVTQKQLIESLSQLKEIKPRKEWAVLLKSQIIAEKKVVAEVVSQPAKSVGIMDIISSVFFQKKVAYAFAGVILFIVGVLGFARGTVPGDMLFPIKQLAERSQATLTGQPGLIITLNNRINDLAQVAKDGRKDNIPSAISEVTQAVKDLNNNPTQDPKALKEIAASLKTLASVQGTDLSQNTDVIDLYQTVVQRQIADLQKATLTDEQKATLAEAQDLYSQGKYTDALERILLINK
jgi:hypothetical protein